MPQLQEVSEGLPKPFCLPLVLSAARFVCRPLSRKLIFFPHTHVMSRAVACLPWHRLWQAQRQKASNEYVKPSKLSSRARHASSPTSRTKHLSKFVADLLQNHLLKLTQVLQGCGGPWDLIHQDADPDAAAVSKVGCNGLRTCQGVHSCVSANTERPCGGVEYHSQQ